MSYLGQAPGQGQAEYFLFTASGSETSVTTADDGRVVSYTVGQVSCYLNGVKLVIGASARQRNIKWRQLDVIDTCSQIQSSLVSSDEDVAVVFGTENSGLTNEELDLCSILMTIPGNPKYFSLNVASAIQVFAYQNFISSIDGKFDNTPKDIASFEDLNSFYNHLEQVLEHINYFDSKKPKSLLMRRMRRLFGRSEPEKEEVAILRGILNKINPYQQ